MQNTIKQIFLAGAGLVSSSKDKAGKIAKELIKKGELATKDKDGFVNDLLGKAEKAKKSLEKNIEAIVKSVVKKLELVNKKELDSVKRELVKIKKELKEKSKK